MTHTLIKKTDNNNKKVAIINKIIMDIFENLGVGWKGNYES